jgi:hypothetical protein
MTLFFFSYPSSFGFSPFLFGFSGYTFCFCSLEISDHLKDDAFFFCFGSLSSYLCRGASCYYLSSSLCFCLDSC